MKKLKVKKSYNVQTKDVLSGFKLWRSRHLLKISWKSPKCIVGTMTFLLVIGGASAPGMGVVYRVKVPNGEDNSSHSLMQGCSPRGEI